MDKLALKKVVDHQTIKDDSYHLKSETQYLNFKMLQGFVAAGFFGYIS